ncbi:NAD(P)H-binding protein [Cryobacterium arcticum]
MRDPSRAGRLDAGARVVVGELTRPDTITEAVAGIDVVVFTQGSA